MVDITESDLKGYKVPHPMVHLYFVILKLDGYESERVFSVLFFFLILTWKPQEFLNTSY